MWYFRSCIGFVEASLQRSPPQLRKDQSSFGLAFANVGVVSLCGTRRVIYESSVAT